ncbi:MAG: CorA family divalent cation transporter [Thermoanaerobacteraceae bacterium]|nr:CorA family divalent cation transporter [Thermoanaerobacteraceae bacterium]
MQCVTKDFIYHESVSEEVDIKDSMWIISSVDEFISKNYEEKAGLTKKFIEILQAERPKIKLYRLKDIYFFTMPYFVIRHSNYSIEYIYYIYSEDGFLITLYKERPEFLKDIELDVKNRNIEKLSLNKLLFYILEEGCENYYNLSDWFMSELERLESKIYNANSISYLHNLLNFKDTVYRYNHIVNLSKYVVDDLSEIDILTDSKDPLPAILNEKYRDVSERLRFVLESANNVIESYVSIMDLRANEQMRFLTIVATLLMPLTVITGIYGMNFDIMPELRWKYGYFIILAVMAVITIIQIIYFKRKKWL